MEDPWLEDRGCLQGHTPRRVAPARGVSNVAGVAAVGLGIRCVVVKCSEMALSCSQLLVSDASMNSN